MPFFAAFDVPIINGTWVPPLWFGILGVPLGILVLFLSLHLMNAWGWVCARWAEVMFRVATPGGQPVPVAPPTTAALPAPPQADPLAPPELLPRPERAAPPAPPAPPGPVQPPAPLAPAEPTAAAPATADDETAS